MKKITSFTVLYDDWTADKLDATILSPQKNDILAITGDAESVVQVAAYLKNMGCTIPMILMGPGINLANIRLIHENEMEKEGWCRKDYMDDLFNRLKTELRRCVDLLDGECTAADGHNVSTIYAHSLLGDYEEEDADAKRHS